MYKDDAEKSLFLNQFNFAALYNDIKILVEKITRNRQITFEYWGYKFEIEDLFVRGEELETRIKDLE